MQCYAKLRVGQRHVPPVFPFIKLSLLPTPTPPARLIVKTSAEIQNRHADEINAFNNQNKILDFKVLK